MKQIKSILNVSSDPIVIALHLIIDAAVCSIHNWFPFGGLPLFPIKVFFSYISHSFFSPSLSTKAKPDVAELDALRKHRHCLFSLLFAACSAMHSGSRSEATDSDTYIAAYIHIINTLQAGAMSRCCTANNSTSVPPTSTYLADNLFRRSGRNT